MKKQLATVVVSGLLLASSCTKVVQIDLNKSNPQYVVEANVTNAEPLQTVRITRSVNFSDANSYPAVTNAMVIFRDQAAGVSDTLNQSEPGFYQTTKFKGIPGTTYMLRILVDGHEFVATSTMPQPAYLDTLKMTDQSSFGKQIKALQVSFHEPPGTGNYYYFMVYRNQRRLKTIYVENDLANDGAIVERVLPDSDSSYRSGDEVLVELQSIPKGVYDYYFSLQQTIEQSSATPANPVTNITGGNVTGYFSAHTADRLKLIVP